MEVTTNAPIGLFKSQSLQAWIGSTADWYQHSLANRLPSIWHNASKCHRSFIEVHHVLVGVTGQMFEFRLRLAKCRLITPMLRTFSKPLPAKFQSAAISPQRCPTNRLSGLLLQLRNDSSRLVGKLVEQIPKNTLVLLIEYWFSAMPRCIDQSLQSVIVKLVNPPTNSIGIGFDNIGNFSGRVTLAAQNDCLCVAVHSVKLDFP